MNVVVSDSEDKPQGNRSVPWILAWSVALSLFMASVSLGEACWRALGYRPSAVDSPALWKYWFERAVQGGPNTITLIGASRIQAGISTSRMRERIPGHQIVQLGKYGGDSPVEVLRALAMDRRFSGLVVCDMLEPFLIREGWESQRELCESTATIREQLLAYQRAWVADLFAINNVESGIAVSARQLVDRGECPPPRYTRLRADRSLELDFSRMLGLKEFRERNAVGFQVEYETAEHPSPQELDDECRELDELVRRIQDRGGQVVFVRMPSSGARLAIEDQYHPKSAYWDRFASKSSAICIHWTEIEGASALACPDDSHLDFRDAIRFTDQLIEVLQVRQVLSK